MVARTILASPLATIACGAWLACGAQLAHASPRTDPTAGRAVFTGATLPNATSIWLNPAALGVEDIGELLLAFTGTLDQVRIAPQVLDANTGALSPGARVRDVSPSPGGLIGVVFRTGRYTLGAAAQTSPAERFLSGYDGLRYHTSGGWQRDYTGAIAGSIRASSRFFVGAAIAHSNTFLRLRYARDTALASGRGPGGIDSDCGGAPCGVGNPLADEAYAVGVRSPAVSVTNLKVTIGFAAEVYSGVWLGVAYHTPPGFGIQTELEGNVDVTRAPRDGGAEVRGGSTVVVQYPASVDAEVRARVEPRFDLHVGGRWEDLSRMQAYDVRLYNSTFAGYGIPEWTLRPRGFHDAFALWAGVERVRGLQPWRYGARLGFETGATAKNATAPMTISPSSFTFDAGGELRLGGSRWWVQLSYGLQLFPPTTVTQSDFDPRFQLSCIESGFDYESRGCAAAREGYAISSAAGEYSRLQHAVRLGLRYALP